MIYLAISSLSYKIDWDNYIFNTICSDKILKRNSNQQGIIEQSYGNGYNTLYDIIAPSAYPINSLRPTTIVCAPPIQSPTKSLTRYFHSYRVFMNLRAHLKVISNNLNDSKELDKIIDGYTHS